MSNEISEIFDMLGQDVIPEIGGLVFPDLMNIEQDVVTAGPGGGEIKGTPKKVYTDVPCTYEPSNTSNRKVAVGEQPVSIQEYIVTFPTHDPSTENRIVINESRHRLRVLERGNEPEKLFRISSIRDQSGVVFEAVCVRENQE